MIKIGQREFKDEKELCKFLANLVHEGGLKVVGEDDGDCLDDWYDLVDAAHADGRLSDKQYKAIGAAVNNKVDKVFPKWSQREGGSL